MRVSALRMRRIQKGATNRHFVFDFGFGFAVAVAAEREWGGNESADRGRKKQTKEREAISWCELGAKRRRHTPLYWLKPSFRQQQQSRRSWPEEGERPVRAQRSRERGRREGH